MIGVGEEGVRLQRGGVESGGSKVELSKDRYGERRKMMLRWAGQRQVRRCC